MPKQRIRKSKPWAGKSPKERFFDNIRVTDTCWLWTGFVYPGGYAKFMVNRKTYMVHRFAHELLIGPIPEGYEVDHLCKVRHCVNPEHLEAVTRFENSRRSDNASAINRRKTHCIRGHELTGDNIYHYRGKRHCKECQTERGKRHRAKITN